jgi:hypothetical protein
MNLFNRYERKQRKVYSLGVLVMNAELMMLVVSLIIGYSLFFMVGYQKR